MGREGGASVGWGRRGLAGVGRAGRQSGAEIEREGRRADIRAPGGCSLGLGAPPVGPHPRSTPAEPRLAGAGTPARFRRGSALAHRLCVFFPPRSAPARCRLWPPRCRCARLPPPPTRSARGALLAAAVAAARVRRGPEGGRRGSEARPPAHAAATAPDLPRCPRRRPCRSPRDLHGRAWA